MGPSRPRGGALGLPALAPLPSSSSSELESQSLESPSSVPRSLELRSSSISGCLSRRLAGDNMASAADVGGVGEAALPPLTTCSADLTGTTGACLTSSSPSESLSSMLSFSEGDVGAVAGLMGAGFVCCFWIPEGGGLEGGGDGMAATACPSSSSSLVKSRFTLLTLSKPSPSRLRDTLLTSSLSLSSPPPPRETTVEPVASTSTCVEVIGLRPSSGTFFFCTPNLARRGVGWLAASLSSAGRADREALRLAARRAAPPPLFLAP
mmetsp:Transcript_39243/g.111107  ORF Transcript_39243/g.111107 Transcript_39243/m.111107 type:complete len:265 (+) Transcript_39243:251-1045(+)